MKADQIFSIVGIGLTSALLISAALAGFGYLLTRVFRAEALLRPFGWPLKMVLGLSAGIFLSGLNVFLLHIDIRIFNLLFLVPGFLFWVYRAYRGRWLRLSIQNLRNAEPVTLIPVAMVFGFWAYTFQRAVLFPPFNLFDDHLTYLAQIQLILERADLIAPFSVRRLYSYGGQAIAQSILLAYSRVELTPVYEHGLVNFCVISLILRLGTWVSGKKTSGVLWFSSICGMIYLVTEQFRGNVSAQSSSFLFFVALAVMFVELTRRKSNAMREWAAFSLVLAVFLTFKCAYVAFAGPLVLSLLFIGLRKQMFFLSACVILLLVPFAWGLYDSSGTIFYPLWKGNAIDIGLFDGAPDLWQSVLFYTTVYWKSGLLVNLAIFGFLAIFRFGERLLLPIFVGVVLFSLATTTLTAVSFETCIRYLFPVVGGISLISVFFLRQLSHLREDARGLTSYALLGALALNYLALTFFWNHRGYEGLTAKHPSLEKLIEKNERISHNMRAMQDRIKAGDPIVSFVVRPYLFNQRRNPVYSLDELGHAAPKKGFMKGDDFDFESYFASLGLKSFIFVDPADSGEPYSAERWVSTSKFARRPASVTLLDEVDLRSRERAFKRRQPIFLKMHTYLNGVMKARRYSANSGAYFLREVK